MKCLWFNFFVCMVASGLILCSILIAPTVIGVILGMGLFLAGILCQVGAEICEAIEKTHNQGTGL